MPAQTYAPEAPAPTVAVTQSARPSPSPSASPRPRPSPSPSATPPAQTYYFSASGAGQDSCAATVDIIWLNFADDRVLYDVLGPGQIVITS